MPLDKSERLERMESMAGRRFARSRNRWRLPLLMLGILFAQGRRTVTTWLRAAGISDDYQDYYYFLAALGCKTESVATRLVLLILQQLPLPKRLRLVIDDSPTKRYGPHVEGADIHRNPTPGPSDQKYLYGHIWVTISMALRHPRWGAIGLPLRAMLYVRRQTKRSIPQQRRWRVCDQTDVGRTVGRMDRTVAETSGKMRLDRHRWRLHEAPPS